MTGLRITARVQGWLGPALVPLGLSGTAANAEVVGSAERLGPLLRRLTPVLHSRGIDVAADDATAEPPDTRPRVTQLRDLRLRSDTMHEVPWMKDFVGWSGASSGLPSTLASAAAVDARGNHVPGRFTLSASPIGVAASASTRMPGAACGSSAAICWAYS